MALTATKQTMEKTQMALPKAGARPAVLTGLIDIGVQVREYKNEPKKPCREFIPVFTLMNDTYALDDGEVRHHVLRPFPMKFLPGATRGHFFELIEALDPNDELVGEDGVYDLTKLLGKPCFVNVEHNTPNADGLIYANCKSVSAYPEDFPIDLPEGDPIVFDLDAPNKEVFDGLNSWVQDQIRNSQDYIGSKAERILDGDDDAQDDDDDQAPY